MAVPIIKTQEERDALLPGTQYKIEGQGNKIHTRKPNAQAQTKPLDGFLSGQKADSGGMRSRIVSGMRDFADQNVFPDGIAEMALDAATRGAASVIESPSQAAKTAGKFLFVDPAVSMATAPANTAMTLGTFGQAGGSLLRGDVEGAKERGARSLGYATDALVGATEFATLGRGGAAVRGVKPDARQYTSNLLSQNTNTLKPNISISDEIAEKVGTDANDQMRFTSTGIPITESTRKTYDYLQKQSGMKPKEFEEFLKNAKKDEELMPLRERKRLEIAVGEEKVQNLLDGYKKLGVKKPESDKMLFNINDQFIVTARGLGNIPETSAVIANAVKQQNINQGKRISKSFDIALGNPDTAFQTVKKINSAIKKEAKPLYEQAFKQGIDVTQSLQDIMSIPLMAKYEKSALKRLKDLKKPTSKLEVLHQVKRKLDGDIGKAVRSGDNTEASDLLKLKKQLLKEIDVASPSYKEARKIYAGEKANLGALEYGSKNIFKSDVSPDEFAEEIANYSKSELESLRVGIKKAISKVEAGKPETYNAIDRKFVLPNTRAKLEVAIGKDATDNLYDSLDAEQTMFKQSSSVDPGVGPRTSYNLESSAKARKGLQNPLKTGTAKVGQAVADANANPLTLLGRTIGGVIKKGTDTVSASYNEQLAKAAADILTRPASEGIEMLLAAAPQEKVGIARQIIRQTKGKPVNDLTRRAIVILSAEALNPEMQNIARGLGGVTTPTIQPND